MNDHRPIKRVCVAGGGIVAWSAAAALKRKLPHIEVSIVATEPPPNAFADHLPGTLPSIAGFHADLGLTDADTIKGVGSTIRLGTEFHGWSTGLPYVHAYALVGAPVEGCSFHLVWLRAAAAGKVRPFDRYSRAAPFTLCAADPRQPVPFEYGLQINPGRYRAMMRAFATHVGVKAISGDFGEIVLRPDGFVDALTLDGGRTVGADLFVDCTGPEARLRSALDEDFVEWSRWLPCDRAVVAGRDGDGEPSLVDHNEAGESGWSFTTASAIRQTTGIVYSAAHLDDADALHKRALHDATPISFRQGRRAQPWRKNVVAIGDAAVTIEPLEWSNLHLAHSAIDRLVSMMPQADCAPVELVEYNRQCEAEADRVRDFVCLHYVAGPAQRSDFWRDAAAIEPPPSLAHTLALFKERGRLPFYEEETFTRDSWLTVLLCQGVRPRRIDPLADLVPLAEVERAVQLPASASALPLQQATPTYALNPVGSQFAR